MKHKKAEQSLSDPVCGMNVTEDSEHHLHYHHQEYFFCSSTCLGKFKAEPEKYIKEEQVGEHHCHDHEHQHHSHTSHSHSSEQPLDTSSYYTCPMHPEIVQDHPGSCPKCGMALEPMTVAADSEKKMKNWRI